MIDEQSESAEFIESLKLAGISIRNENEVVERLAEAREWHFAFRTLVREGKRIGIWFDSPPGVRSSRLKNLFARFRFSSADESIFEAALHA